jgi:hypothetical protein
MSRMLPATGPFPCAPPVHPRVRPRRVPASPAGAALLALAVLPLHLGAAAFVTVHVPAVDLELMPESERPFRRVVIGLDPVNLGHFIVPDAPAHVSGGNDERAAQLREQLFQLKVEIDHGEIFRRAPREAVFFVAVPDPKTVPEASGTEAEMLRRYLVQRAGWSPERAVHRVRAFTVPQPLPYPQDMAEVIGFDHRGRLVLAIGGDTDSWYVGGVQSLVQTYPDDFAVRTLGTAGAEAVNTEGGDLSVIWLPEGKVGVLVGRHRIVRFLDHKYGREFEGEAIDQGKIEEARRAFSTAFFGREVVIAGEAALKNPGWVSDDVFHADMVVVVLRHERRVVAFVPTFAGTAVDAVTGEAIAADRQRLAQQEYDLVANQMSARGFSVVRLPFADHPVRSPVNVSRFFDPRTAQHVVLLARYPDHRAPVPGYPTAEDELDAKFEELGDRITEWTQHLDQPRWDAVQRSVAAAWEALRALAARPDPLFAKQAADYEANGVRVLPLPMYPSGEGGLHCLVLR